MRISSFLLITLLVIKSALSQNDIPCLPCLPQGINFTTQAQIDSFPINYPNCNNIEGDVDIGYLYAASSDITNLLGLSNLRSIGGYLSIHYNPLQNLTGLDSITSVGGNFDLRYNLINDLSGLSALTWVGNNFMIRGEHSLNGLTGLTSLNYVGGLFEMGHNNGLANLQGIESLTYIGNMLYITGNPSLTSLTGLHNLTEIGSILNVSFNNSLTSLSGLDNIDAASISGLHIWQNIVLSTCEAQSICNYLASPNGAVDIQHNATGCNSPQEVEDACESVGIEFRTAESSFNIYPNPSSAEITIESPCKGYISILNLSGQQILQQGITEPTTTIDVGELKSGVYFVRLTREKTAQFGKFMKL